MNTSKNDQAGDSVQLKAGDKFHYRAPNGVTYFKLEVIGTEDGNCFPMVETAPACAVLPVELDDEGGAVAAYFLSQAGRPEVESSGPVLKAVGAFCNFGEESREAAIRCLEKRIGITAQVSDLIPVGQVNGFGDQYQFPIDLYMLTTFSLESHVLMEGCTRVRMTLEEIADAQIKRSFFNDETPDMIATMLLRNLFRAKFDW